MTARSEDFLSLKSKLASLRQGQPASAGDDHSAGGNMAGIMAGDVRLEEALARMTAAEQLQRQGTPGPPHGEIPPSPASLPESPAQEPMRAALDEITEGQSDTEYAEFAEYELPEPEPEIDQSIPEPAIETVHPAGAEPPQFVDPSPPVEMQPGPEAIAPSPLRPSAAPPRRETPMPQQPERQQMLSGDNMLTTSSAFERLSHEMFSETSGGGKVLEDATRDMIKPILKRWLDDNLPTLVERLVREEIERVARRGGR